MNPFPYSVKAKACESINGNFSYQEANKAKLPSFPVFDYYLRANEDSEMFNQDRAPIKLDVGCVS